MLKRARERNGRPLTLEGVLVSFFKDTKGVRARRRYLPDRVMKKRKVRSTGATGTKKCTVQKALA